MLVDVSLGMQAVKSTAPTTSCSFQWAMLAKACMIAVKQLLFYLCLLTCVSKNHTESNVVQYEAILMCAQKLTHGTGSFVCNFV